jgi:hypothetical protein
MQAGAITGGIAEEGFHVRTLLKSTDVYLVNLVGFVRY